ncbi:MAG: HNH endonuclease [Elusimicrobia bacterium]|nr:HNH endonuclease [Elusimicrobiota bacterium]
MDGAKDLSDEQLLTRLENFVDEERLRLHSFLAWLGEADRRKLLERRGYSSTFDYCVRCLKLSEDEAYRRITAARAAVTRPELLSAMAAGQLSLAAVSRIAPHVRRCDAPEIIARAEGKSKRQIDEMLASLQLAPAKRDVTRIVSVAAPGEPGATEIRVEFSFRGSPALRDAIERIRQLLSHKCPGGGMDEVLLEIARDYLKRHDPQKGLPGRAAPAKGGSVIPADVRRAVWARDGGRCAYVGTTGVRCLSRRFLEMDHVRPRAHGGGNSAGNLRLLCRAHNDSERRRILGEGGGAIWALSAARRENHGSPVRKPDPRPGSPRCASP